MWRASICAEMTAFEWPSQNELRQQYIALLSCWGRSVHTIPQVVCAGLAAVPSAGVRWPASR